MPAHPPTARPAPTPLKKAARLANVWGWSYIVTILVIFGAKDTPAGPLRQCVVDTSVLFTLIGILELVWRHKLLKSGDARWARVLALNEVGGTLALFWNLWLVWKIPQTVLVPYFKSNISPATWTMLKSFGSMTGNANAVNDALIGQSVHLAQSMTVFILGPIVFLFQVAVIIRYLRFAGEIGRMPAPVAVPPVLR